MKIFLASDHAGYNLKEKIKSHLEKSHEVEDLGTDSEESCDYTDYIIPAAKKVAKTNNSLGIVLGESGQGEAIAANKVKGIRAAAYYRHNLKIIKLSKEHNDTNVLSLGARFLTTRQALKSIDLWIKTKFTKGSRHVRRINKIKKYETKR